MKIHLAEQEKDLAIKYAQEYRKKTGDNYSLQFIITMLSRKYENNLALDLKTILDEKIRNWEEEQAQKGKSL